MGKWKVSKAGSEAPSTAWPGKLRVPAASRLALGGAATATATGPLMELRTQGGGGEHKDYLLLEGVGVLGAKLAALGRNSSKAL